MLLNALSISLLANAFLPTLAHVAMFHPAMYGFNVTDKTFNYDNRAVTPLVDYTFDKWWFHGHLDFPPPEGEFFDLPAGKAVNTELACNKGATSFFASSEGGDIRNPDRPNDVCPNSPLSAIHTTGFDDVTGCALAIAYKSNVADIKPEDFTVFSINQTCVWTRNTEFTVPVNMPACPPDGCHCAWFWIHSQNSGGEQNYMNGFKCKVSSAVSATPLAPAKVPRRCGADPPNGRLTSSPSNCTYGAKQPLYWFQKAQNNMFEGTYSPPLYTDLYNFRGMFESVPIRYGAQEDIFLDSYADLPEPSPTAKMPVLADVSNLQSGNEPSASGNTTSTDSVQSGSAASGAKSRRSTTSPITTRSLEDTPLDVRQTSMWRRTRKLKSRASLWHMF